MRILTKLIPFVLISCVGNSDLKYVDFGDFKLKLPSNYQESSLGSPDSYAAKIAVDWGEFMFDYGLYSPKMTLSPEEYIASNEWEVSDEYLASIVVDPSPKFIKVEKEDSIYKAIYSVTECLRKEDCYLTPMPKYLSENFELLDSTLIFKFSIPKKISEFQFFVDETDSIYKRVFVPYEMNKYKSGVYILNKNSCQDEMNCWEQLSLWASDSIKIERQKLIEILKSVELK